VHFVTTAVFYGQLRTFVLSPLLATFRLRLSACLSVPRRIPAQLHLGNGRGCPLVVHCWADLQSMHGFRCYENTAANAKCQRVLVLVNIASHHHCTWQNSITAQSPPKLYTYSVPTQETAKHRAKFGWLPLSDVPAVTKPRRETR